MVSTIIVGIQSTLFNVKFEMSRETEFTEMHLTLSQFVVTPLTNNLVSNGKIIDNNHNMSEEGTLLWATLDADGEK